MDSFSKTYTDPIILARGAGQGNVRQLREFIQSVNENEVSFVEKSLYKASTETSSSDIKVKHNLDREKEFTHCNNPLNRHLTTKGKIENELLFNKKPTMGSHKPIL